MNVDVSVVVMSYNNEKFLAATIESVLAQEGINLELIVVDDCSTDASVDILERYVGDPRFSYQVHARNMGAGDNYNYCAQQGSGRYVAVLGSDDILLPDHLRSLCAAMDACPSAMLGYTQCEWIDEHGRSLEQAVHPGHARASYSGGRNEVAALLSHDNYITPSAIVFRRSGVEQIVARHGVFAQKHLQAADWELWVRIALHHPDFVFLKQATVGYRIHAGQVSQKFYADDRPLREHTEILERVLADISVRDVLGRDVAAVWSLYERRLQAYPETSRQALGERVDAIERKLLGDGALVTRLAHAQPRFSVILTTFNRPDLLRHALQSLADQQFRDFEVIVVNDHGSPVESVLEGLDFPVTYLCLGSNQGLSAARNAGIAVARGRYLCYLDDDDIYLPGHLAALHEAFLAKPDALVYTDVVYVQERLEGDRRVELGRSFPTAHDGFDRDLLFVRNYIPVNTWAHPRAILDRTGGFDISLSAFEDWDMLLRLVSVPLDVAHVEQVTAEVRQRAQAGGDHMLARESGHFRFLYKRIYSRHPQAADARIEKERQALLESLGRPAPAPAAPAWGIEQWLAERKPSAARTAALQALLAANEGRGHIGVALVDERGDAQALARSLQSLRQQDEPAQCVWVCSDIELDGEQDVEWLQPGGSWTACLNDRLMSGLPAPDFLFVLMAGDCLLPQALLLVAEHRLRHPTSRLVYIDEYVLEGDQAAKPILRPDFNLDMLRSYPYVGRALGFDTALARELGGLEAGYGELALVDLLWRAVEQAGPPVVGHVSEVLLRTERPLFDWAGRDSVREQALRCTRAHLERMGVQAQVVPQAGTDFHAVRYSSGHEPMVSIVVPTRNHAALLRHCIDGLLARTAYANFELLIVDNGSTEPDACEFLERLEKMAMAQLRVLRWPHPFNFSAINNFALEHARGELILFLNNDVQFSTARKDWLNDMVGNALRPEIGLVGARLDYPDGRIQQNGLILGMGEAVGAALRGQPGTTQGYMSRAQVQHNVSALSAACLMARRDVLEELGGFDAQAFPLEHGDVDLCLRAGQAGFLLTILPDTGLQHLEGASRLLAAKGELESVDPDQVLQALYQRWLPRLSLDPYHHPAFDRQEPGFALSPQASRLNEPLPGRPLPVVAAAHADWQGCGYYRVIHPFQALEQELRMEGGLAHGGFHFLDLARAAPDVVVLQGAWINPGILTQMQRYRDLLGCKVVLEFDDYTPNIPVQSIYYKQIPRSLIKTMRRAIEQADWLVVSTPTLAAEYAAFHPSIRIARNGLSPQWWSDLKTARGVGRKPRVGWAGGSSHTGDLAVIRSVVKELEDEVEWVFMGMKPEGVVCEFHPGVAIDRYPAKLASLNLDLAVVPLELNQFNRCKSNLRLLELGACGVPVICTDIDPYQGDLPVTRVRNRHQEWAAAIRAHLADPQEMARRGDALRDAVRSSWMLEGSFMDQWVAAWTI
ncbi:glycosyltransferase [Alcaligenes sp. WGS1538]|uniref:glycosyltransferase n=1 Tax=Alcaligenes sp. WGS1538 TaxID=3366811 RepID=UPI00372D7DCB